MSVYTVHEPPAKPDDEPAAPERFVFVRDGFSFWAFLLTPLWMLRHRMWAVLACYAVAVAIVQVVLIAVNASASVKLTVGLLMALLAGFEAATLRRWTLGRRKFSHVGVVVGDDVEMAEQRFFDSWVQHAPIAATASAASTAPVHHAAPATDVIGLFPDAGVPR